MILYRMERSNKENHPIYFITNNDHSYSTTLFTNVNSVQQLIDQYNNSGMFPMVQLPSKAKKQCTFNEINDLYRLMPEEFI